ncbi:MAG: hypothetical protein NTX33_03130 [Propionibacteriales bacterium]|nr:hypothetical protein [Propionibacteriales bacterium]
MIEHLLAEQDGVIARRQALAAGCTEASLRRMLRRRELVVVHPGVYVDHTGPLTWRQRAWAAVLITRPSALGGRSAIRAHDGPGRRDLDDMAAIDVVVPHRSHPAPVDGVRFRRSRRFEESVQLHMNPPRQRYDDAVIELADLANGRLRAIAVLADACGNRRTTAARLQATLATMTRVTHRSWLSAILQDVAEGTCSVLEHAYLVDVERPHGLPRGERQQRDRDARGRSMYRDVVYGGAHPPWRRYVELDGRLGHTTTRDRDRDLERDLDAALEHTDTVRLGYGQVFERACATAAKVARLLQLDGWQGVPTGCPRCPQA